MLNDPGDLATALGASHPRKSDRRRAHAGPGGIAATIRVLALIHVLLVTSGTMDGSWARAKSLGMSHSQVTREEVL